MNFFSLDLVTLLIALVVVVKFNLHNKFICKILKGVSIYLPPNDKDYQMILDLNKDKKQAAIVRTCGVDEYLKATPDENIATTILLTVFFLSSFCGLTLVEVLKVFSFYGEKVFPLRKEVLGEVTPSQEETFNISTCFAVITVIYWQTINVRLVLKNGLSGYDSKICFSIFLCMVLVTSTVSVYFKELMKIDYESICDTVNDRLVKIIEQSKLNSEEEISFKLCNAVSLQVFCIALYSVTCALSFRASTRNAYFQQSLIDVTEKLEQGNVKRVGMYNKVSQVLNVVMFVCTIDPLLNDILVQNNIIGKEIFNLMFYFITIINCFFELVCIKYKINFLLSQSHQEMLDLNKKPSKQNLFLKKTRISYVNNIYWEVYFQMFYQVCFPALLATFFLNRIELVQALLQGKEIPSLSGFLAVLIYMSLSAVAFSKAVFGNCYSYYMRNVASEKSFV